ncbi:MAG: septum formation protein Maf [Deltaproteobacteria bacterium]|nr:septum formation protein Maf [Deltaproteobacteria bacterium]MBW2111264.1 septum formation protein Maf [Deltaproteobacteria bacterium]
MPPFPPISRNNPLILASASPRRRELLTQVGLPFRVIPGDVNESEITGEPARISLTLAEKKAARVYPLTGPSWILGADTLVVVKNRILGKPRDQGEAREMLELLGGVEHSVVTGFCLLNPEGEMSHSQAVTTTVRFKPISRKELDAYIITGEPFGKAGAYAIQGIGAFMVESISGSYSNVVGLPLCAVIEALILTGALRAFPIPFD